MVTLKKNKKWLALIVLVLIVSPLFVMAQEEPPIDPDLDTGRGTGYTLLEPIGSFVNNETASTLGGFLAGAFRLGVAVATALAVLMIVVGGVQYMGSESGFSKEEAKDRIYMAIFGLLLAVGAFVILQTVNPDLVEFDIVRTLENIKEQVREQAPEPITPGTDTQTNPPAENESEIRAALQGSGIVINNLCPSGQNINCTNVGGLPANAVSGLISLQNTVGGLVITGGTEDGHQTHGQGRPVVDLRPSVGLNTYLLGTGSTSGVTCGATIPRTSPGAQYVWEPLGCNGSTGPHWHVVFN